MLHPKRTDEYVAFDVKRDAYRKTLMDAIERIFSPETVLVTKLRDKAGVEHDIPAPGMWQQVTSRNDPDRTVDQDGKLATTGTVSPDRPRTAYDLADAILGAFDALLCDILADHATRIGGLETDLTALETAYGAHVHDSVGFRNDVVVSEPIIETSGPHAPPAV